MSAGSMHLLACGRYLALHDAPTGTVTVDAAEWTLTLDALRTAQATVKRQERTIADLRGDHPLATAPRYEQPTPAYRAALVLAARREFIAERDRDGAA